MPTSDRWEVDLGRQIRTLRLRQNLDQQQLADRAGIALNAVKNLEGGKGTTLRSLVQALREAATIAAKGRVVTPHIAKAYMTQSATSSYQLPIPESYFTVIHEGMRMSVTGGTASLLNIPQVAIAAKTGTAELGTAKARVNSWVIGFCPYEKPRYAFAIVMDRGTRGNATNASYVGQQLLYWMGINTPEYTSSQ